LHLRALAILTATPEVPDDVSRALEAAVKAANAAWSEVDYDVWLAGVDGYLGVLGEPTSAGWARGGDGAAAAGDGAVPEEDSDDDSGDDFQALQNALIEDADNQ